MKLKKNLLRIGSYIGLGISSLLTFAAFVDAGADDEMIRIALAFFAGGGLSRFFYLKEKRKFQELELVRFAIDNYGKVTVPEVAVHFNIKLDKARKFLDKMTDGQVFHLTISEEGASIYNLSDFSMLDESERFQLLNKRL